MGLYDRDYTQENWRSRSRYAPQMQIRFPRPSTMVMRLLIINGVVFVVEALFFPKNIPLGVDKISVLAKWFSVFPYSLWSVLQIWRLVTYQFLHANVWHILFNMLWLYFLGPVLERHWGSRRFLLFYLGCGVAGGLFYLLLVAVKFLGPGCMVGASAAIMGVFAACAILFPQISIYLFPLPIAIPIRIAAIAGTAMYVLYVVLGAKNAGGHAAHLAGMAAGAAYVLSQDWRARLKQKVDWSRRQKKTTAQRNLQLEVDRILQKVHDTGIHSLSRQEKRILKKATEAERLRHKL